MTEGTETMTEGTETCERCRFWDSNQSQCRRHAPIRSNENYHAVWPNAWREDWCGDFSAFKPLEPETPELIAPEMLFQCPICKALRFTKEGCEQHIKLEHRPRLER
jgi:hypothetical protein